MVTTKVRLMVLVLYAGHSQQVFLFLLQLQLPIRDVLGVKFEVGSLILS